MKWLKNLFKRKPKTPKADALRSKVIEMYGEEAGVLYDMINSGQPIGDMFETAIFLHLVENARDELNGVL